MFNIFKQKKFVLYDWEYFHFKKKGEAPFNGMFIKYPLLLNEWLEQLNLKLVHLY